MRVLLAVLWVFASSMASAAGYPCLIESSEVVEIRSSVDGVIAAVRVQRGDRVRAGQVLVELQSAAERVAVESARYRAQMDGQIAAARTRLEFANRKLARMIELEQKRFVAAQARDEAEAEQELAQNELAAAIETRELARIEHRRAQEQLALRTLVSPFSGVVVDRMLNPGDLADSGSGRRAVLKLARTDPLKVDVVLPAALFGKISTRQPVTVIASVGGGRFPGRVKMVDRVIDAASGSFVVRLELPNPQGRAPIGSRCTAEISTGVQPPPLPRR